MPTDSADARGLDPKRFLSVTDVSQTKAEYDEIASAYEADLLNKYGWRGHERIAEVAAPRLLRDAPLLDCGCGSGLVGVGLTDLGFVTIDGFDISEAMLEETRAKGIYRDLRPGTMGDPLDYSTDAYQATFASGMFTPGHAPPHSFDEMIRVTAPGGYVIFSLRSTDDPGYQEEMAGYHAKMDELVEQGRWRLDARGEEFQSMPVGEPDLRHRIWCFQVTTPSA